jgi:hypothetical protein
MEWVRHWQNVSIGVIHFAGMLLGIHLGLLLAEAGTRNVLTFGPNSGINMYGNSLVSTL